MVVMSPLYNQVSTFTLDYDVSAKLWFREALIWTDSGTYIRLAVRCDICVRVAARFCQQFTNELSAAGSRRVAGRPPPTLRSRPQRAESPPSVTRSWPGRYPVMTSEWSCVIHSQSAFHDGFN